MRFDRGGQGGRRWRLGGFVMLVVVLAPLLALNLCCTGPLMEPPLARNVAPLVVDPQLEVARRYAPWILHEVHPTKGRQDLPTRVDFDGNLRGDDNWDHFPRWELPPVVWYAALETATHWFIAYHLFHPRDWSPIDLGLHMTHENDGENLQVVVAKASGRVILLFTQAHYRGGVYVDPEAGFADGDEEIRGPLVLVDDAGRPASDGCHAVVYVESCGHGIYGLADAGDDVELAPDGQVRFDGHGLVFRPARSDEEPREPTDIMMLREPSLDAALPVPYALASTLAYLWPRLKDGSLVGEGGLVDGCLPLHTPELDIGVPRYYEADRFSGPFGPDRGISPFAVDFRFGAGEVGALFFDPARRYAQCLRVPQPWSTEYLGDPFATK